MKTKTKTILALEIIFVIGVFAYFFTLQPTAIAPISGHVIGLDAGSGEFNFRFENARKVIIAKNPEFDNAVEFDRTFAIDLPPGTYYWKVRGWIRESTTSNFTLAQKIALRLDEINGELMIYNTGTQNVKIRVLDGEEIFGEGEVLLKNQGTKIENPQAEIIIEGEAE